MNKIIKWAQDAKNNSTPQVQVVFEALVLLIGVDFIVLSVGEALGFNVFETDTLLWDMIIPQIATFFAALVLLFKFEQRDIHMFGFKGAGKRYFKGFLIGVGCMSVISIPIIYLFNEGSYWETLNMTSHNLRMVFLYLLFFIIQGASEELVIRAVMMPTIARKWGMKKAVLATSLLFAILHLGNPNVSYFGVFNIFISGLLFGVMAFYYESFWEVFAFHSFWNFTMGNIFGINVSGIQQMNSLFNANIKGPNFLTGGSFGVEASILATVVELVVLLYFVKKFRKKAMPS